MPNDPSSATPAHGTHGWQPRRSRRVRCRFPRRSSVCRLGGTKTGAGLGIWERCEEQYVVYHSVQLSSTNLDSFEEKPVRFVEVDRRAVRAKHLKLHALQSLPECSLQGRLQQCLPNPLATEARFHSHSEPANMRDPFK